MSQITFFPYDIRMVQRDGCHQLNIWARSNGKKILVRVIDGDINSLQADIGTQWWTCVATSIEDGIVTVTADALNQRRVDEVVM